MLEALAALVPPLVVATAFCALVFSVVRREIGAKRQERPPEGADGSGP